MFEVHAEWTATGSNRHLGWELFWTGPDFDTAWAKVQDVEKAGRRARLVRKDEFYTSKSIS